MIEKQKIIDISWPITENITAYKNRKIVSFQKIRNFSEHNVRESIIQLGSHSGTHIDAPSHFLQDGLSVENTRLNALVGPAHVIDCRLSFGHITAEDLMQNDIKEDEIILFRTKNSDLAPTAAFDYEFVYLREDAARYLVNKRVRAVGIDYLGIERNQPAHETHTALLSADIPIIEGLRLAEVAEGHYQLVCLPLAIVGLEASPARAILIVNQ